MKTKNHLDLTELSALDSNERKSGNDARSGSERLYIHVDSDEPLRIGINTFYPRGYMERQAEKAKRADRIRVVIAMIGMAAFAVAALIGWVVWLFGGVR